MSVTPIIPAQLFIPSIGINTKVVAKPSEFVMDEHLGYKVWQFGVPTGPNAMYEAAWWSSGPKPGSHSHKLAVLLGHTRIGGYGVFNNLGQLKQGAPIILEDVNGTVLRLKVIATKSGISKTDPQALQAALINAPPGAKLGLITCSGSVNQSIRSHKDNTLVYAG